MPLSLGTQVFCTPALLDLLMSLQIMYDVIYFYWCIFERRYFKCAVGKVTHQKHRSVADSAWILYDADW
jgi:hypothetical protein